MNVSMEVTFTEEEVKTIEKAIKCKYDLTVKIDNEGNTLAHAAAIIGKLDNTCTLWNIKNNRDWLVGFDAAVHNTLPKDFNQWNIKNEQGISIGHIAAANNKLPYNFDQWDIQDNIGTSIAHIAVFNNCLPLHIDRSVLELMDIYGLSVLDAINIIKMYNSNNNSIFGYDKTVIYQLSK